MVPGMEDMEAVFRALADQHRRRLLDGLRERDGQALGELEARLPEMTRFGVMKHLRVLETAGLVTTRRHGRHKLHFLNPLPIRLISDRWISRYAEPVVNAMVDLKHSLERQMSAPNHVYEVYIRATPERVWQALIDPEMTRRYYYGTLVQSTWEPGAPLRYDYPDGTLAADGSVLEVDPPRKLVMSFNAVWDPEIAAEPPVKMTWEITPMGESCRLAVTTHELEPGSATDTAFRGGVSVIVSGLKTLLETGQPMPSPSADPEPADATV
jgi:uncharacterized protein YndB with AHSA1/START domain